MRLILVSNRVSLPDQGAKTVPGGLAVAAKAALKNRGGLWFGWSGEISEEPARKPRIIQRKRINYAVVDLSSVDYQEYYNGLANQVLWPVLHYRVDLQTYSRAEQSGYVRVNRRFADSLDTLIQDDDVIWVHDYHLMPLARELRARGRTNPIGFFLHIPCPPVDILQTLPHHEDILGSLAHYDLIGFQTDNDRENFANYLASLGAKAGRNNRFVLDGLTTQLGTFPVGIETATYARLARTAARQRFQSDIEVSLAGLRLVLGVDRLDYSKGIMHRLHAFARFLELYPQWRSRVTYLQIAPKSRAEIKEYAANEGEITAEVGRINGRFGEASWTPIRYVNRSYSRTALAGLFRFADVALVTPLRDGMNLVAKEFIAAQDADRPGVLVLSQFAGAVAELGEALIVNPHETEAVAATLNRALEMPLAERRERHAPMYERLLANDVGAWTENFLSTLRETRTRNRVFDGLRAMLGAPAF